MQVIKKDNIKGVVLTIGVLDGVHLGHRAILNKVKEISGSLAVKNLVITLYPDPEKVLAPGKNFTQISSLEERIRLFEKEGMDYCYVLDVDRELLAYSPEDFFRKFIYERFAPRAIVAGGDFRFGKSQAGDVSLLRQFAEIYKFPLTVPEFFKINGIRVSSSAIRRALGAGNISEAAAMLGRFPRLAGRVITGQGRGRSLGFPTANITVDYDFNLARGVYAGDVELQGEVMPALLYSGTNPTFQGRLVRNEIYIPDFNSDLYGSKISFLIKRMLRKEIVFKNPGELQLQIKKDLGMLFKDGQ